jgi:hypothetical protein
MRRHIVHFTATAVVLGFLSASLLSAQAPTSNPIKAILDAHKAWPNPPASIQIVGNVIKGDRKEPVTITANQQEETLIDYGGVKRVETPSKNFQYDAEKVAPQHTLSGFAQLDVTSVFLLAHLVRRPLTFGRAEPAATKDQSLIKIHVRSNRTEKHYVQIVVNDEVDIFTEPSGLLAGISRSFYQSKPPFNFTMSLTFSDYRDTNGVLLPYRIERLINGLSVEAIAVDSYAFDVATPGSLFERPRRAQ